MSSVVQGLKPRTVQDISDRSDSMIIVDCLCCLKLLQQSLTEEVSSDYKSKACQLRKWKGRSKTLKVRAVHMVVGRWGDGGGAVPLTWGGGMMPGGMGGRLFARLGLPA